MDDQDSFVKSCEDAQQYPENLVKHNTYTHNLNTYSLMLNERAPRLFCLEEKACLDVWEYYDKNSEFDSTVVSSRRDLKIQLEGKHMFDKKDPRCRFLFIQSRHSRDCLRISQEMFLYALTYHQVAPEFLEYIFAFGWQEYQDDFHFSGFRESTRLLASEMGLAIPALGRSGRDFRLCYALKSAEKSSQESSPWSIRQTAIYHSFEVDTGKMFSIFVKGNEVIRDRVQQSTKSTGLKNDRIQSAAGAFALSLETHLLVCGWATENWRWYINFLDQKLQDLTRSSLAFRITKCPDIVFPAEPKPPMLTKEKSVLSWKSLLRHGPPTPPLEPRSFPDADDQSIGSERKSTSPILWHPPESQPPPPPPPPPALPPSPRKAEQLGQVNTGSPEFSIDDLQDMQSLEDKLNETSLVLISNTKVLQELKTLYVSLTTLEEFPEEIKTKCQRDISKFSKRITNFISDLQMHQSRAATLLRLLADRKTLLYGILDYRAIEANRLLAKRAQESAERMENMTKDMSQLAMQTKEETVSMKIITLVTLFFLPGTFISTVMSTDIIRFPSSNGGFQWGALSVWLKATLPLMFLTFVAWGVVYKGVQRGWFTNRNGHSDRHSKLSV